MSHSLEMYSKFVQLKLNFAQPMLKLDGKWPMALTSAIASLLKT